MKNSGGDREPPGVENGERRIKEKNERKKNEGVSGRAREPESFPVMRLLSKPISSYRPEAGTASFPEIDAR